MKVIVSLSGGLDSTTVLADALTRHYTVREVETVGFVYPSKHNDLELCAARAVAASYGVPFTTIDVSDALSMSSSALLRDGGPLPLGHYEAESMRKTVVPGRNLLFISTLAGLCESLGGGKVLLGTNAGDHHIYSDCRPVFLAAADCAVRLSSDAKVEVSAPFKFWDKAAVVRRGLELGAPYHMTRSCFSGDVVACGRCGSCQARLAAFAANGRDDPLAYVSREIMPKSRGDDV